MFFSEVHEFFSPVTTHDEKLLGDNWKESSIFILGLENVRYRALLLGGKIGWNGCTARWCTTLLHLAYMISNLTGFEKVVKEW